MKTRTRIRPPKALRSLERDMVACCSRDSEMGFGRLTRFPFGWTLIRPVVNNSPFCQPSPNQMACVCQYGKLQGIRVNYYRHLLVVAPRGVLQQTRTLSNLDHCSTEITPPPNFTRTALVLPRGQVEVTSRWCQSFTAGRFPRGNVGPVHGHSR